MNQITPLPRRATATKGGPNAIDEHVGRRIRDRRVCLGLSQGWLGDALGLTFQQVQKYEKGSNRVGASRLWHLAQVLDVPIGYFYEGLSDEAAATAGTRETMDEPDEDTGNALALMRIYSEIRDPAARRVVRELATLLARARA